MRGLISLVALFHATRVLASPLSLKMRTDTSQYCGQWDSVDTGKYSMLLNQWGSHGVGGTQCAQINSLNRDYIGWKMDFNWYSGIGIMAFPNIQLNEGINRQLSSISNIHSTWKWTMSNTNIVADVAYDLFTSYSPYGSNVNEIMIWLANYHSGPIAEAYDASGKAMKTASNFHIAGHQWDLFKGWNGQNTVFSFLPSGGQIITSFSGDLYLFLEYLMEKQYFDNNQYLITAQAGSEVSSGSATFTTKKYSISVD